MKVRNCMTTPVFTVHPMDSLRHAARLMWDRDCGALPVADGGLVVGMITDRDICMAALIQQAPLGEIFVVSAMSRTVHVCTDDDTVEAAEEIMRRNQVRRLPVQDGARKLVGILSLNDLARRSQSFWNRTASKALRHGALARTLAAVSERRDASVRQGA